MEIKVKSKYLKSSAQKVRPVLYGVRGQNPAQTLAKVSFTNTKGALFLRDILKSGLAAAKENDLEAEKLSIKSVFVSDGPKLKRRQIGSRGRSNPILKRMCHITLIITDEGKIQKSKAKQQPTNKTQKANAKKSVPKEENK